MRRPLIDIRMKSNISGHYTSKCTIQTVLYSVTIANQKVPSGYFDVLSMVDIQCRMAPFIETRMTDDEQRTQAVEAKIVRRTVKLNGYFPSIDTRRMVAKIDGILFHIRGVEADSMKYSTRLRLEILTP